MSISVCVIWLLSTFLPLTLHIGKGENYAPTFLRLNSQGTLNTFRVMMRC